MDDRSSRLFKLRELSRNAPWQAWFAEKEFSQDWASPWFPIWSKLLAHLRNKEVSVLEVGSFEGRSAIFWLEYLPHSRVTCIDHFSDTKKRSGRDIENRFDKNLSAYVNRIIKIKDKSASALSDLKSLGTKFDVIYIDGPHFRDEVLIDSLLAWPMLHSDGIMIFDDYLHELDRNPLERAKDAIDSFLRLQSGQFSELHRGYQIAIRKN